MADTLGLYQESLQLARDLGYVVREEALGDVPGGRCEVNGRPHVLLDLGRPVADRLAALLQALAVDPRAVAEPKSRLLESRLRALAPPS